MLRLIAVGVVVLGAASGCDSRICGAEPLAAALRTAVAGDVVEVGACEIAGSFTVPAGVTLRGVGPASILRSADGAGPVLECAGDGVHIESLTLSVDHGDFGLRAVSGGALEVRGVSIRVTRGLGLGVRGGTATLSEIDLQGPITAATPPVGPTTPDETGTFGVVARDATLQIDSLRARGFALGAVSIEGGELHWMDDDALVDIEAGRGVGLGVFGATAELNGVEVGGLFAGVGFPGVAIAASVSGSTPSAMTLTDVTLSGGAGYGIFADGSALTLANVDIEDLGLVAVQVQDGTLGATDLTVLRNGGAGVILLDAGAVSIERATIDAHRCVTLPADARTVELCDGIHARRVDTANAATAIDLQLTDVTLDRNARAGMLLDGADTAPARLVLTNIHASADAGAALGVATQHAIVPTGWDDGVMRDAVTQANDTAFEGVGMIDVAGLIMPPALMARPPTL